MSQDYDETKHKYKIETWKGSDKILWYVQWAENYLALSPYLQKQVFEINDS